MKKGKHESKKHEMAEKMKDGHYKGKIKAPSGKLFTINKSKVVSHHNIGKK